MSQSISRRRLLGFGIGATFGTVILAACSGGAATPTAPTSTSASTSSTTSAPAKPTAASSTSSTSSTSSQTAPATQAPSAAASVTLRLMDFAGVGWEQDPKFMKEFMAKNPSITVKEEPTIYAQMFQKCLTLGATGTLADLFAGHNKWMPYLDYKGVCLELDPLVKEHADINFSDFFPSVIADARGIGAAGKLYVLPTVLHPGGNAIVIFNNDLLDKAGVKPPASSDWSITDFEAIVRKAASPKEQIFGTNVILNSPLYADQVTRSWGADPTKPDEKSWLLSKDGKTQQLDFPEVKASFEWYWQLIKDGLVPTSDIAPPNTPGGDFFIAGKLATTTNIVGQYVYYLKTIKDKFKFSAVLWPKGPHGYRGSCLSYNTYSIYAKTKNPEQSFGLLNELTGTAIGQWAAVVGESEPYARYTVWSDPKLWKVNPVTKDAGEWLKSGVDPFPQPDNLRFTQWLDAWTQNTSKYLDGKEDWNQMYAHTQKACQDILDQPKP